MMPVNKSICHRQRLLVLLKMIDSPDTVTESKPGCGRRRQVGAQKAAGKDSPNIGLIKVNKPSRQAQLKILSMATPLPLLVT